jgi:hypothetical protein
MGEKLNREKTMMALSKNKTGRYLLILIKKNVY